MRTVILKDDFAALAEVASELAMHMVEKVVQKHPAQVVLHLMRGTHYVMFFFHPKVASLMFEPLNGFRHVR